MAPVLLRPANVYGRSSGSPIVIPWPVGPEYALHALHVNDCADAYVALAEHPRRVEGEVFDISAHRYETVEEVLRPLAREYRASGL